MFEPKDGETARWRILYALLREVPVDEILSYATMGDALDLHPDRDRHQLQMTFRRASLELEVVDKRATEAVKNTGYRVVKAPEHVRLAQRHQSKSSKSLTRAHSKVQNVDYNELDLDTRQLTELAMRAIQAQLHFNRSMDIRQKRLEDAVANLNQRTERSDDELAELRERLDRLERGE
jgi:hypothetical protein